MALFSHCTNTTNRISISSGPDRQAIISSSHRFKAEAQRTQSFDPSPRLHDQEMSELGFEPVHITLTTHTLYDYRPGHRYNNMESLVPLLLFPWAPWDTPCLQV